MTSADGRDRAPPSRRLLEHFHVLWRAALFGLAVYAVVRLLVYLSGEFGWLDWMK